MSAIGDDILPHWNALYPSEMPQDSPSRRQEQFIVRFPDGMRDRIAATAKANGRSMNSEIIARLEASFGVGADDEDVAALVDVLTKSLQTPSVMELLKKVSGKK